MDSNLLSCDWNRIQRGLSRNKIGLFILITVALLVPFSAALDTIEADQKKSAAVTAAAAMVNNTTPAVSLEVVTKSSQQDSFYFDPAPISQDAVEGSDVKLRCDVSNRRHISFYWTLNGRPILNTTRRYQDDSDLRIIRVDKELDSGSLRCIAKNVSTGIALRSTEAKLNILWIAKSTEVTLKQPEEKDLVEAVEVTLKCEALGEPEPNVEWIRNGHRQSHTERIKITKSRLKIVGATAADNGAWTCAASNSAGSSKDLQPFLLNIPGKNSARLDSSTFTKVAVVRSRSRAQLDCLYHDAVRTEWHKGQRKITDETDSKYRVLSNGTLIVDRVEEGDIGEYRCVGVSDSGPLQTFTSLLKVAYLKDLTEASFEPRPHDPHVIPQGKELDIYCIKPDALPAPTLKWLGPYGTEVPKEGRVKAADGRLTVSNAEVLDSGNYTCVVSNLAGSTSWSVNLAVSVPPKISRPPLSVRVTEDDVAQFDCKITATPYPVTKVIWLKSDQPISNVLDERYVVDEGAGLLNIRHVTLNDDANYACSVTTDGHPTVTSTNAHLYVEKKLKFRPTPVNTTVELGSNSTIRCRADGRVPPSIRWVREGGLPLQASVVDRGDGDLQFLEVKYSDAGYYNCIASSSQGSINATLFINVVVKPRFKVMPANTTGYEGYPTMLHCVTTGDPLPFIQWDKNSQINVFDQRRFKVLSNGSLHISEVYIEDMGRYGCTAGNGGGFVRAESYLKVTSGDPRFSGSEGSSGDDFSLMKTIIIAVCSALAYLAVVIGLTVYCSIRLVRAKKQRKQDQRASDSDEKGGDNLVVPNEMTELMEKKSGQQHKPHHQFLSLRSDDTDVRSMSGVGSSQGSSSCRTDTSSGGGGAKADMMKMMESLRQISKQELHTLGMLGKGQYGDIHLANCDRSTLQLNGGTLQRGQGHNQTAGSPDQLVVVKSLLSRSEGHEVEFCRELRFLSSLNHEKVVRLIGVCKDNEPYCLISEYCEWGDLKQFLLALRNDHPTARLPPLNSSQKLSMCYQVAQGMEHIASSNLVHRDLAARNVLLTPTLEVKVACLSVCRDVYAAEYFLHRQRLVPLRWMAPESIMEEEYSWRSDVWSYGVFLWEVFSLAEMPYRQWNDEMLVKSIGRTGEVKLTQLSGPGCPSGVQELVDRCCSVSCKERPSFSDVLASLRNFVTFSGDL